MFFIVMTGLKIHVELLLQNKYCCCYLWVIFAMKYSCIFTLDRVYTGRVSETAHTYPANSHREHSERCWDFQRVAFRSVCSKGKV